MGVASRPRLVCVVVFPGEAEAADVLRVDPRERRIVAFAEIAAGGEPFGGMLIRRHQALEIDLAASRLPIIRERERSARGVDRNEQNNEQRRDGDGARERSR